MKLVRYIHKGQELTGIFRDGRIFPDVSDAGAVQGIGINSVRLLSPVIPSKIVLVGLNYRDHAKELGMPVPETPVIFLKPPTALIGPGDRIIFPGSSKRVDHEAELAVIIGSEAKNVPRDKASEYIFGYTCFNDVTARDLQKTDVQWTRAKSFDTFAPIGPWIETELDDPSDVRVTSTVNGILKQDSRTSEFIFSIPELIEFISGVMTLLPGDIIATGTPPGAGPVRPGDTVSVDIEGIGRLVNHVEAVI